KNKAAKQRIDSIYSRIQAGDDFAKLATAHSDDKGSSVKNGELPWFGTGRMIPEFESAAFALKNIGDISKPIQSSYGWHIIKMLDKRGIASFDNLKEDIQSKVKRDERAQLGQKSFIAKLKSEYNYKVNAEAIADYYKLLENKSLTDSTFQLATAQLSKPIISFATKTLTQADFNQFLKANTYTDKTTPATIINEKAVTFGEKELLAYEDKQLENKYEDFRFLMQEYHDGILLFEVSNNEVWDKASRDTAGLATYFKQNTADYKWEKPHYKGRLILCKDKNTFKLAKKLVKKIATDSIDKYLTTRLNDSIQYVKVEKNLFVQGDNKLVDNLAFKTKTAIEPNKDYPYAFVVGKLLKTLPENYTDVRGLVTADYQEYLEKQWITELRKKYKVEIDSKVLNLVKQN
ncbi:MAG: peptidylprolyl isomerase, partial [Paludibacter sp.]|nr:peptidylprolyl isomerase [Paludibacter sp.]